MKSRAFVHVYGSCGDFPTDSPTSSFISTTRGYSAADILLALTSPNTCHALAYYVATCPDCCSDQSWTCSNQCSPPLKIWPCNSLLHHFGFQGDKYLCLVLCWQTRGSAQSGLCLQGISIVWKIKQAQSRCSKCKYDADWDWSHEADKWALRGISVGTRMRDSKPFSPGNPQVEGSWAWEWGRAGEAIRVKGRTWKVMGLQHRAKERWYGTKTKMLIKNKCGLCSGS